MLRGPLEKSAMPAPESLPSNRPAIRSLHLLLSLAAAALLLWQPRLVWQTLGFVAGSLLAIAPIVVPGLLLAAWVAASGAGDRFAAVFRGRSLETVLAATLVGALSPVCGVTVLPLLAGLLAAGIPLAPVMAFWLSSPITDPAMLSVTVATLGWKFALGKTLAAIGLGLLGGGMAQVFSSRDWVRRPLRSNGLVGALGSGCRTGGGERAAFVPAFWRQAGRRSRFARELWSAARLLLLVLPPAFAAEFLLNEALQPDALAGYVGGDSLFAVPLAVFVGGPAYLDGYAALPLTRALLDHGMSPGAAMAFLVSGGVVSLWGALAILPVLRLQPFLLYLALALAGSLLSGWLFGAL